MHYNVLNVINVRLGPSLWNCGQLCFPKRSLSVVCVIGYCVCFIVACLGQCYQCKQLGKVCQEDPVSVGIIEKGEKAHLLSSFWTESMNSLLCLSSAAVCLGD